MENSMYKAQDQNYLYSSTSPLPLVNPWKFQCTQLDQNYLHSCNFTIPLVNSWKFPCKRLEQPYLYSCNLSTILLVYLWKSQCTSWLDQIYFNIILLCGISLANPWKYPCTQLHTTGKFMEISMYKAGHSYFIYRYITCKSMEISM